MRRLMEKISGKLLWFFFFTGSFYIIFTGGRRFWPEHPYALLADAVSMGQQALQKEAARMLYPALVMETREEETASFTEWYVNWAMAMHPLKKLEACAVHREQVENAATYEMLVTGGVHDENETDEEGKAYDLASLAQQENEEAMEQSQEPEAAEEPETQEADSEPAEEPEESRPEEETQTASIGTLYNLEELSDFDYLTSHFYTIEPNTYITPEELDAETLLAEDMGIDKSVDGPQILIYHTHSQEGFVDSVPGDNSTTIVGAGELLTQYLTERGYQVLHVTSVYDLIDGKLDRNEAYSRAQEEISGILETYPSIQSVIDLHRDGVSEGTRLVTELNGKTMAKFMFFNGLSRTRRNGAIDYLYNPYKEENLALTLQLKLLCEQYYPGLSRNIYLKSLRYNLHLSPKALLIEVGAQTNTVEEIMNTMEPLADLLDKVFGT